MGSVIRAFDLQRLPALQGRLGQSGARPDGDIHRGRRAVRTAGRLDRIVIEGSKATGIALKDGRTVRAQQFVASTLNVHQTFEDYIGRAHFLQRS